jgi:cardiolipin synthase
MSPVKSRHSFTYTSQNTVKLIRGGQQYFSLLIELIHKAQHSIHLQVYIYDEDETGRQVAEALIAAAQRGVSVYLVPDGYASQNISAPFIRELEKGGVNFRFFQPILKSDNFYFGRRLHHKVFITDARYCLVGGINISNKYNDGFGKPAWLDWALYAEGEIAPELVKVCLEVWTKSRNERRKLLWQANPPIALPKHHSPVRIRRNDWVQKRSQITQSYLEMFHDAKSHIYIMSSYFLPGMQVRKKLARAARRGVKVKLVLAGISDVKVAKHAERYIYRWIFRNNIEVYEYNQSVLHAKISTYDGKWATVGSYNVNNISAFASVELNLDVKEEAFAANVQRHIEEVIKQDCERITEEDFRTRYHFMSRVFQQASYQIVRVLFFLFTFYFKQRSFKSANAAKKH